MWEYFPPNYKKINNGNKRKRKGKDKESYILIVYILFNIQEKVDKILRKILAKMVQNPPKKNGCKCLSKYVLKRAKKMAELIKRPTISCLFERKFIL